MQDTLGNERPPHRRLEIIHQKTNVKRDKVNRTKNNEILLYELGEAFRHIFNYLGIHESASKAAVSRTFSNSVDAWLANKQDLDLLHENLSHVSYSTIVKLICRMPWLRRVNFHRSINISDDGLRNTIACK